MSTTTCPGVRTLITPPHTHCSVQPSCSAGMPPSCTIAAPGVHGAGVTGTQGIGVSTPAAAAVAQSQAGLKSIRVRAAGEGSWNIEASASPTPWSPCKTKCAPNLGQLKGQYPQVKLWLIYYKTLYQGTSGKHSEDSQEAIELLQKSGFHVLQWNEALDMEKAGTLPK
jgi:hypothetical protein